MQYILAIRDGQGNLQVDAFLPDDEAAKEAVKQQLLGAIIDHMAGRPIAQIPMVEPHGGTDQRNNGNGGGVHA